MSAYSDWKCGAIPDERYAFCANHETGADHGEEDFYYDDEENCEEDDIESAACEARDGYKRWR